MTHSATLLERDGAQRLVGAAIKTLPRLMAIAARTAVSAGTRMQGDAELAQLLSGDGSIGRIALAQLGREARPVRAILFDKSPRTNWGLGWHQDRTIAVRTRRDVPGFGPWSVKRGMAHVAPPMSILDRMLTIRVHLDEVPIDNAPLLIAPGSHRLGRIPENEVSNVVTRCGIMTCVAEAGDVWLYATPILHASEASRRQDIAGCYSSTMQPKVARWSRVNWYLGAAVALSHQPPPGPPL